MDAGEIGTMVGAAAVAAGTFPLDVTASLQKWVLSPGANLGWIFVPAVYDDVRVSSSEAATITLRPVLRVTYAPPVARCTKDEDCDDGRFCNGVETCNLANLACRAGAIPSCDDGVACTADSCDAAANLCVHASQDVLCDDGDLCTDDACDASSGCRHADNTAACNDGDACTDGDRCLGGACVPGAALSCDDGVDCTADSCNPVTGCRNVDACPAGQVCNVVDRACEAGPTTVAFQQGVNGYGGTMDTYLSAGTPDTSNALATPLVVDGPVPAGEERQILLRFDQVFGSGPAQVPAGARIISATLTMYVVNASPDGANLHRMLGPWSDTDTWNSTGGGIQHDGTEAFDAIDAAGATNSGRMPYDIDVTPSLVRWSGGQANRGWVFVTPEGGTDSWQLASSEDDVVEWRPRLEIAFIPCDPGYAGDGVACFDVDECAQGAGPCDPNATCTNTVGSYGCRCNEGWEGDGRACLDIDECQAGDGPCDPNATCTNLPGAFECGCIAGWEGDGRVCTDVDECGQLPAPCDENATCTNLPGTFACACDAGFVGDGTDCGECPGGAATPCNGRGTCGGTADAPACTCNGNFAAPACADCVDGYFGTWCDRACPGGVELPCNGHGTCQDGTSGTGACACDDGFVGSACDRCADGHVDYPVCLDCTQCLDDNPCTTEVCTAATGCEHQANTLMCDDGNACTMWDQCRDGACGGTLINCADTDPCTRDTCDPVSGCAHAAIPGCCTSDAGCALPGRCLFRACDAASHACGSIESLPDCCVANEDCDDGDAGTLDGCDTDTGLCSNLAICSEDADCDDGDPCTTDTCFVASGRCVHEAIPGCCGADDCTETAGGDDAATTDAAEEPPETTGDVPPEAGEDVPEAEIPPEAEVDVPATDEGGEGLDTTVADAASEVLHPDAGGDPGVNQWRLAGGGCTSSGASAPSGTLWVMLLVAAAWAFRRAIVGPTGRRWWSRS